MDSRRLYFDPNDDNIKKEILTLIIQYLDENGFRSSAFILSEEAHIDENNSETKERDESRTALYSSLKKYLKNGDWSQIEALQLDKTESPRFIYQLYRYHFLELLNSGDAHSALTFLSSRLRPYKPFEDPIGDFDSLCLLLCDSPSGQGLNSFPDLEKSLEKLLAELETIIERTSSRVINHKSHPRRLERLMQQAAAERVLNYSTGTVKSIIHDFKPVILPKDHKCDLPKEHVGPIKSIKVVHGTHNLVSGGSDGKIILWNLLQKSKKSTLNAHSGRVWSVAAYKNSGIDQPLVIASAGGDGKIVLWPTNSQNNSIVLDSFGQDVYSIDISSSTSKLVSGGFDREFSVYDLSTCEKIAGHHGHQAAITSVIFDPSGNLAVTGGKDLSVKIWDLRNGIVVKTLGPILSEVTSVDCDRCFTKILASVKNSTIKLWDLRMSESVNTFKGHKNLKKHFIRASFGPDDRTIMSGSDDGRFYFWGVQTGQPLRIITPPNYEPLNTEKAAYEILYFQGHNNFISTCESNVICLWNSDCSSD